MFYIYYQSTYPRLTVLLCPATVNARPNRCYPLDTRLYNINDTRRRVLWSPSYHYRISTVIFRCDFSRITHMKIAVISSTAAVRSATTIAWCLRFATVTSATSKGSNLIPGGALKCLIASSNRSVKTSHGTCG